MKILIAYTASGTSDNPFVRLLADGIRACGYEVVCSVEEFRSNAADYDIVHLQWPEELFSYPLAAGETFTVPEVIMSYSADGFSQLSHQYHTCIRSEEHTSELQSR